MNFRIKVTNNIVMMKGEKYVVVMDLGSSVITGIVGMKRSDATLAVCEIEKREVSEGAIRRGVVHNIEEVSNLIREILSGLGRKIKNKKIKKIYVALNSYSLRTFDVSNEVDLSGEIVDQKLLDSLKDGALSEISDDYSKIDVIPQSFISDDKPELQPLGTAPKRLKVQYKVICTKSDNLKNLEKCLEGIRSEFLLGPIASSYSILSEEDKNKGVVAVDIGSGVSSITIYKNNVLKYLSVLPLGSNLINKDLMYFGINANEAEYIKVSMGSALHYSANKSYKEQQKINSELSKEEKERNEIIVARTEELVDNIWANIKYSGVENILSGIIMTGGGCRLKDLDKLLQIKTRLNVRIANPKKYVSSIKEGLNISLEDSLVVGMINFANENCLEDPIETVKGQLNIDAFSNTSGSEGEKNEEKKKREEPHSNDSGKKPKKKLRKSNFGTVIRGIERFLKEDEMDD